MNREPTVIYSAANTQQAYLLKGLLEERGIAARVVNDAVQMAGGELPLGWPSAARVVVAEQDAASARAFAAEFDRRTAYEASDEDSMEPLPLAEWPDWPICPRCGQRRTARCGVCGAARTDFRLAELQPSGEGEQVLLQCEDCDDVIQPQWYRRCAACGHDFGSGIEADRAGADETAVPEKLWAVALVLLIAVVVLATFFALLFASSG